MMAEQKDNDNIKPVVSDSTPIIVPKKGAPYWLVGVLALTVIGMGAWLLKTKLGNSSTTSKQTTLVAPTPPVAAGENQPKSTTNPSTAPAAKTTEVGTAGSSGIGVEIDHTVRDLMADVACRTMYMSQNPATTAATVAYGDYNGDKVEDELIGLTLDGTGKYGVGCVYTVKSGSLSLLWKTPEADSMMKSMLSNASTSDTIKYFGVSPSYSGPTAAATPDTTYTYKWSGNAFFKQ